MKKITHSIKGVLMNRRALAITLIALPFSLLSMEKNKQQWDGNYYKKHSSHQFRAALEILDTLNVSHYKSILDLGCGSGDVTAEIATRAPDARVIGIDSSQDMIKAALANHNKRTNLFFIIADAQNELPFEQRSFDLVFSSAALLWIKNKQAVFDNLNKCLMPGGHIVLKTTRELDESHPLNLTFMKLGQNPKWQELITVFKSQPQHYPLSRDAAMKLLDQEKWKNVTIEDHRVFNTFDSKEKLAHWMMGWIGALPVMASVENNIKEEFLNDFVNEYVTFNDTKTEQGLILYTIPALLIKAQKYRLTTVR